MPWLTAAGPSLLSGLSQPFVSHANLFALSAEQLKVVVARAKLGATTSAADQSELQALVGNLLQSAQTQRDSVTTALAQLDAYRTQMLADRTSLHAGLLAAIQTQEADNEAVQQVRLQISAITQKLTDLGVNATSAQIATGKAIASVIVGLTFSLALSGGVVAIGGFALAIFGVAGAAISEELNSDELKADLAKLADLTSELADDQAQLAMVTAVVAGLQALVTSNDDALVVSGGFTDAWDLAVLQLQGLAVALAQPTIDVNRIPDLLDLDDAIAAWNQCSTFAQSVQNAVIAIGPPVDAPTIEITRPALQLVT